MERNIKALREIIGTAPEKDVLNKIQEFHCKNADVENFLMNKAVDFEKRNKSRTYLLFNSENLDIIGYYTISNKAIDFSDKVTKSVIKKIDGFSSKIQSLAVILIGQLGKNSDYSKSFDGKELLDYALNTVYEIQDKLGGRICLIETENAPENYKVINFYKNNDFKVLQNSDNFLQMFKLLDNYTIDN